ncbi:MAG: cytochrome P450 [Actinomycetota bacterium]
MSGDDAGPRSSSGQHPDDGHRAGSPPTGVVPGSIGDLSIRLGQDVRELLIDGRELSDIHAMIDERERRRARRRDGDEVGDGPARSGAAEPDHDDLVALYSAETYRTGAPHGAIDRLRTCGPIVRVPEPALDGWPAGSGYWAVLSHAETKEVLLDATRFSSHLGGTQLRDPARPQDLAFVREMMLNQDPPDHTRLRGLLAKAFTPRAVASLGDRIESRAHELVAAVADRGRCDLVRDVVADLPVAVLAEILGVPEQDRGLLYDWSNRVIGYQDADYAGSDTFDPAGGTDLARAALLERPRPRSDGTLPDPRSRDGLADLYAYANALADHKRADPGDDIMSLLLQATYEGTTISNAEFETLFFLFAVAGNETLRNGIPGGVLTLVQHPSQYRLLLRQPDLLGRAVEEMLRYWPPVIHFRRTATVDTELAGTPIAAGDKVAVYHLAANRDPAVFDQPERFDITRNPNDHVSFGFGPHFCLGAHLARLQMRAMVGEILGQLGRLELDGEPVRLQSNFQQGLKSLPVRWSTDGR